MLRVTFPPLSTRQGWVEECEVLNADDGTRIDLSGTVIKVQIAPGYPEQITRYSYPPYYDDTYWSSKILATTADGSIIIPDIGIFVFFFQPSQLASLCPGQYVVGCNIARVGGEAVQFFLGELPILDGVVPT